MTNGERSSTTVDYLILGGGVAGLAIARELVRAGRSALVVEKAPEIGGLARTHRFDGFSFDMGGHRFHSNNPEVVAWLKDLVKDELLTVERRSRIYMQGRFVDYPIQLGQALSVFGRAKAVKLGLSYAASLLRLDRSEPKSFEDWVVQRFGRALYDIYFKPYTEKVWGIQCHELSADWAAQRISLPSLTQTVRQALIPGSKPPPTIVPRFYYPRTGYGVISRNLMEEIEARGGRVETSAFAESIRFDADEGIARIASTSGTARDVRCGRVISTIPIEFLLKTLSAQPGAEEAARKFRLDYRGIILIYLALAKPQVSPDHWTYFPYPDMLIGRSHEPKNWSPAMVPNGKVTSLSLEVFSSQGEPAWQVSDAELGARAAGDLEKIGWIKKGDVIHTWVLRVPFAYPVYYIGYEEQIRGVRSFLDQWPRLSLLGRTGAFRYMNVDGVIEDVFRLLGELGVRGGAEVAPLAVDEGRWA